MISKSLEARQVLAETENTFCPINMNILKRIVIMSPESELPRKYVKKQLSQTRKLSRGNIANMTTMAMLRR